MLGNCSSLKSIDIPSHVESIGEYAFYSCISLERIVIPSNVKRIDNNALFGCASLESVVFNGKTMQQVRAMDNYPWGIKDKSIIKAEN